MKLFFTITTMNKKIDIKLTAEAAQQAASLAKLVAECEDERDPSTLTRAMVLAEQAVARLGSVLSRVRLALGVKEVTGEDEVEVALALLNEALLAIDDAMDAAHLANSPSQVKMAIERAQHALMDGIRQRGGEA